MNRRRFLTASTVSVVTGLAGCAERQPTTDAVDSSDLGLATVKATGSLDDSEEVYSGWVHLVMHGDGYDLTFDVRVCHGRNTGVAASLAAAGGGRYEVTLSKASRNEDATACEHGTRIWGSSTLPKDLETLTFVAGGEQVLEFEKEGGTGEMRPLPDPLSLS